MDNRTHRNHTGLETASRPGAFPLPGLVAVLLATFMAGCGGNPEVVVVSTYPEDGAMAIPADLMGKITFSEPYTGDLSKISATLSTPDAGLAAMPEALQLGLTEERTSAEFHASLLPETRYCLSVTVEAQPELLILASQWSSCFTTKVPCGVAVHVGRDSEVITAGSLGGAGLAVLNATADAVGDDLYIAMILQDKAPGAAFPMSFTAVLTGFVSDDAGDKVIPPKGVTSSIPGCTIDADGRGRCFSDEVVIPLSQDGHDNTVLMNDAELTWESSSWNGDQLTFQNFNLSGYATEEAVAATLTSFGEGYEFLAGYMKYDLDLDGDGEYDALTLSFDTNPAPLELKGTACE